MISLILSELKNITLGLSCAFNLSHFHRVRHRHPFCPTSTHTSGGFLKNVLVKRAILQVEYNMLLIYFNSLKLSNAALLHVVN